MPPPRNSTQRVSRHANAHFHVGVAIEGASEQGGALRVQTSAGPIALDFLIFATGFKVDWRQRPMLRHIASSIRLWKESTNLLRRSRVISIAWWRIRSEQARSSAR